MKIYNNILYLLVVAALCCSSCTKWLTVDTKDRIMEDKLFSTQDGYLVALNGIYIGLLDGSLYNGKLTFTSTDVMGQYYDCSKESHSANKLSIFKEDVSKHIFDGTWTSAYTLINNINTVIEHCDSKDGVLDEMHFNLYKGEALALRAMLHFDLLRIYGPIFKTNTDAVSIPYQDYSDIKPSPLLKASEVADKIMKDLYLAEQLLEKSDVIINEGPKSIAIEGTSNQLRFRNMRLNYYAVKGLIARAAIYFNDETIALKYASSVIDDTQVKNNYFPFTSSDQMGAVGLEDKVYSSEILFSLYNLKRSKDVFESKFSSNLKTDNSYNITDKGLGALYEDRGDTDLRYKFQWDKQVMNADTKNVNVLTKFNLMTQKPDTAINKLEHSYYFSMIRISEMYLIKAECLRNIDETQAYLALNTVRRARSVSSIVPSPEREIMDCIQWEYAREFIGEGQLFWFYKRRNMIEIPNIGVGVNADGVLVKVAMDSGQFMFDIPQAEIDKRK